MRLCISGYFLVKYSIKNITEIEKKNQMIFRVEVHFLTIIIIIRDIDYK